MKRNIQTQIITALLLLSFCISACEKFVEVNPPVNQVASDNLFITDNNAVSAVAGLYSNAVAVQLNFFNGGVTIYSALAADELTATSATVANLAEFSTNTISVKNLDLQNNCWSKPYNTIYHANAILEGFAKPNNVGTGVRKQLTGECLFLRALSYFYLVNLFGDVPLITSTDYLANSSLPRAASSAVYDQIINDLRAAKDSLGTSYPSTGKVRANKWTATSLLARAYLYQKDYTHAEEQASEVLSQSIYSLTPNVDNVFLANSSEAIFQFLPVASFLNTAEGSNFIPFNSTTIPNYSIPASFISSFETNDKRKNWTASVTISGQTYYYPYKYKVRSGATVTEYNVVFRLSELYLIRAEARAQLGSNLTGALADVNIIRNRAGLPLLVLTNQAAILNAIARERQVEFFAEWGQRWLDLKRTGTADAVLGPKKPTWKSTAILWPIPINELLLNPLLTQNLGY